MSSLCSVGSTCKQQPMILQQLIQVNYHLSFEDLKNSNRLNLSAGLLPTLGKGYCGTNKLLPGTASLKLEQCNDLPKGHVIHA